MKHESQTKNENCIPHKVETGSTTLHLSQQFFSLSLNKDNKYI